MGSLTWYQRIKKMNRMVALGKKRLVIDNDSVGDIVRINRKLDFVISYC